MNARTKGGAKQEFEQKKQRGNEYTLEYYGTKLQLYLRIGEPWAHFGNSTQVVLAHAADGINIQPCKTKLFQSKVEYLGHRLAKEEFLLSQNMYRRSKTGPYRRHESK